MTTETGSCHQINPKGGAQFTIFKKEKAKDSRGDPKINANNSVYDTVTRQGACWYVAVRGMRKWSVSEGEEAGSQLKPMGSERLKQSGLGTEEVKERQSARRWFWRGAAQQDRVGKDRRQDEIRRERLGVGALAKQQSSTGLHTRRGINRTREESLIGCR